MTWVVFVKAIFSCLHLKTDDGFLPYTMSVGLSLFTNLFLKGLGSVFGCHTHSLIRIYNTISFSNLATMILVQWVSQII